MEPTILCLDIGHRATGAVLVDPRSDRIVGCHVFRTRPMTATEKKARAWAAHELEQGRSVAREFAEWRGSWPVFRGNPFIYGVVCEFPSGGAKSGKAMRSMGYAAGMWAAILEGTIPRAPVEVYTPREVKLAATGRQHATKEQVADGARYALSGCSPIAEWTPAGEQEHLYDAAATYLAARVGGSIVPFAKGAR